MGFIFSSLGAGEILLVLVVALLLFGAERLPSIARTLGQGLNELRRTANELMHSIWDDNFTLSSADPPTSNRCDRHEIEQSQREG